jgi:Na+-transporting methylmalonyl-CoA/oxaloacetate decarboxylase gamma subunit
MTDTQIFAFLVMPFLFALTCRMVFVSSRAMRSQKSADPPKPVSKPNADTRKSRQRRTVTEHAHAAEDYPDLAAMISQASLHITPNPRQNCPWEGL